MPRKRVLLPVLGLVVLAVVVTTLVATGRLEDRSAVSSAYSAHPVGCKALYLVLEELGLPVSRFRRRFTMLDDHSGVLVVVNPHVMPFSRREIATLKQWIKRGNRLVLFQGLETQMGLGDADGAWRRRKAFARNEMGLGQSSSSRRAVEIFWAQPAQNQRFDRTERAGFAPGRAGCASDKCVRRGALEGAERTLDPSRARHSRPHTDSEDLGQGVRHCRKRSSSRFEPGIVS